MAFYNKWGMVQTIREEILSFETRKNISCVGEITCAGRLIIVREHCRSALLRLSILEMLYITHKCLQHN